MGFCVLSGAAIIADGKRNYSMSTATKTVQEIGLMSFSGNVIPHTWYQHITKTTEHSAGKAGVKLIERPYLEAIVILSDIVYWYRPQIVRDEKTGQVVSINKRFAADKLQRSYQQLADMFGLGKDQARAAVKHLEKSGLITTEFRTLVVRGVKLSNVLYIEPVPTAIARINTPISLQTDTPRSTEAHPPCLQTDTNTETSQEITQKNPDAQDAVSTEQEVKADIESFFDGVVPEPKATTKPKPEKRDAVLDIVQQAARRASGVVDWLLPGTVCGDHGYLGPYRMFCDVIDRDPSTIGEHKTLDWLGKFETIALVSPAQNGNKAIIIQPDIMAQAINAIRDDWSFTNKKWRTPYNSGFAELVELTAAQIETGTIEANGTEKLTITDRWYGYD